jgi:hypothetical protein
LPIKVPSQFGCISGIFQLLGAIITQKQSQTQGFLEEEAMNDSKGAWKFQLTI